MATNGTKNGDGKRYKVALIASGNRASAIATIIGRNVRRHPQFEDTIKMFVFQEEGKHLPGPLKLPDNIVAVPNVEAATDADIVIVDIPKESIPRTLAPLKGKLKPGAFAISLIKVRV